MTSKLFKNVLSDDPKIGTANGPTVASRKMVVPALENLAMEVACSTSCRLFVNQLPNERKEENNPLYFANKYENKLINQIKQTSNSNNSNNSNVVQQVKEVKDRSQSVGAVPLNNAPIPIYSDTESSDEGNNSTIQNQRKHQRNLQNEKKTCCFYESIDIREEDGRRTTVLEQKWGPTDGTYCGIFGVVVKTLAPVYVPFAYNNPIFNGTVDMVEKGCGMICCPIFNSKRVLLGILQIAITGDAHLDNLALGSPGKSVGKFGLIDSDGILTHKGRRGGQGESAKVQKISSAVGAIVTLCSNLAIALEFYKHIYHANVSTILKNESQLIRLFTLWSTSVGIDNSPEKQSPIKEIEKRNYNFISEEKDEAKIKLIDIAILKKCFKIIDIQKEGKITFKMILRNLSPFGDVIKLIKTSKRLQDMFTMNSLRKSKNALSNLKEEGFLHEKEFINIFIPYKEEEKETITDAVEVTEKVEVTKVVKKVVVEVQEAVVEEEKAEEKKAEEEKAEEEKEIQFDEWCEVYDPASGCNYYQNLLDETVTQWELPNGFDPVAARKRVKLLMSCGSISELPHGLALLVATRKIQSVYRAKLARGIMRGKRAEKMSMSRPSTADGKPAKWMKMHDHHSGYDYYYNNEDGSTTWDVPQDYIEPKTIEEIEFNRLTEERIENLKLALEDAEDMDVIISIVQMIPEEVAFDALRVMAKKKLNSYNENTVLLRHNQKKPHRGSLLPDHIGTGHSH